MPEELARGQRRSLPTRRAGYNQKIKIGGQTVHLRTGEYEDGSLGEVFLDCHKTGSSLRALLDSLAKVISVGLQYGVPLQAYVKLFKGYEFLPSGKVMGDPRFTEAASILDYLVRELESTYLGEKDARAES